ncbi:hypothetical protein ONZ45_g17968 [Pleurotus djamor]|nr:hypothetical protein ONZ45_g17968 [Pleurotus djamor]
MSSPARLSFVLLIYIVSVVGLTLNSSTCRYASFILILSIFGYLASHGTSVAEHPANAVLTSFIFTTSGLLAFSNPHELRMAGQIKPTEELPVSARTKRAVMLLINPRLVGWNAEPSSALPPRSRRTSRLGFAAEQLVCLMFNTLMLNAATMVLDRTPQFQSNGPRLSDAPWISRSMHVLQFAHASSSMIKAGHYFWTLALLATGRWSPSDFRPIFGSWFNAYTVCKFWGRTWHQLIRHTLTTHARFISRNVLGFPRDTKVTKYVELYLVFFVSGLLHFVSEVFTLRNWTSGALRFFTLQAAAIHLEQTVIALASKLGLKRNLMWQAVGLPSSASLLTMSTAPHPSLVPLTYIVSIVGLTFNSPTYRYASFILIFGLFTRLLDHGMPVAQHLTATNLSTLFFTMSGSLALSDPHELRMVGQTQPTNELPVLGRIKWAVMLFISPRLVGWTAEPTFVLPPRSRRTSRLGFAAEQLVHLVCNLLVTNVASMVIEYTPEFRSNGPRLSNAPWLLRSLYCLTFAIASSSAIRMAHEVWILALLATGRWSPSDFAPIMGTWSNAYTLRKFWGRTWHQVHRNMLTIHARFVTQKVLRLPRHNQATALIELYSAFFISGLFHYTTEYFIFQNWSSGAIRFFILQAVAIHLEGIVIDFASSRLGSKQNKMWEVIGYIWVLQWFTWSLPIWIEPQINGGIIENGAKIQVIQTLLSW